MKNGTRIIKKLVTVKKIFFGFLFLFQLVNCSCQTIKFGIYKSKNGSTLEINNKGLFKYSKELHLSRLDVKIGKKLEQSRGYFKKESNFILLNTSKTYIDSIINRSINVVQRESSNSIKDSTKITLKSKDFLKVYICGTGLEILKNINDASNALLLDKSEMNIGKIYNDFSVKVYLNFDDAYVRSDFSDIKKICFESKLFKRDSFLKDIEIEINFDPFNFYFVDLKDEIVLIKKNKLYFKGEEFVIEK